MNLYRVEGTIRVEAMILAKDDDDAAETFETKIGINQRPPTFEMHTRADKDIGRVTSIEDEDVCFDDCEEDDSDE